MTLGSRTLRDELFWKVILPWRNRTGWRRLARKYIVIDELVDWDSDDITGSARYLIIGGARGGGKSQRIRESAQEIPHHPVIEGQVAPRKLKA